MTAERLASLMQARQAGPQQVVISELGDLPRWVQVSVFSWAGTVIGYSYGFLGEDTGGKHGMSYKAGGKLKSATKSMMSRESTLKLAIAREYISNCGEPVAQGKDPFLLIA